MAEFKLEEYLQQRRRKRGEGRTEALLRAQSRALKVRDHTGQEFSCRAEMCRAWGVSYHRFSCRLDRGWTVKEALTLPWGGRHGGSVCDHTGRRFASKSAMCRAWGVPLTTYYSRLGRGFTLEQALTHQLEPGGKWLRA